MRLQSFLKVVRENLMFLLIILGVFLGFAIGLLLNKKVHQTTEFTPREMVMFIGFPGELFLRMLMLVVLPFVASSVITSLTTIDKNTAAKLGKRAAVYFLVTSLIATSLAVTLGKVLIKPQARNIEEDMELKTGSSPIFRILDMIRNMVPANIVETSISSTGTQLARKVRDFKFENISTNYFKSSPANLSSFLKKEVVNPLGVSPDFLQVIKEKDVIYEYAGQEKYDSTNLLGALVLAILFGAILSSLGDEGKPIVDLFRCLFQVSVRIVHIGIWFSPIGIGSIIASKVAGMEDIKGTIENLGLYIATTIAVLFIYGFVILPSIYLILLRRNPIQLFTCVFKAIVTSFGTSSSAATIPVTTSCLEKKKFVDGRLVKFLLPIGTVTNAPGSAIYVAVAAIFIVQTFHPNLLSFTSCVLICISSSIAVLGTAPIPAAAPIMVQSIALQLIGIPMADIQLLVAVDWFVDRFATLVNVWSNCVACVIIEHYSHKELQLVSDVTTLSANAGSALGDHENTVAIDIVAEVEGTIEAEDMKE